MLRILTIGLLVAAALVVMNPRGADAYSTSEKAWLEPIMQRYLNAARPVFESQFGEEKAREYLKNIMGMYNQMFEITLDDPYSFGTDQALVDDYNRKLEDLAAYLLGQGLSTAMVDEKVTQTMEYYENLYDIRLSKPDLETSGMVVDEMIPTTDSTPDNTYVKDSIRRLGGIVTNHRPVSTLLGDDFRVQAGFKTGVSIFDRKLSFRPPVGFPERRRPKKIAVVTKEVVQ